MGQVDGKGDHRKLASVGPETPMFPLRPLNVRKPCSEEFTCFYQLLRDHRWILEFVVFLDGGPVLVPVFESCSISGHHELQPLIKEAKNVTDVTGVLESRPFVRGRPLSGVGSEQDLSPCTGKSAKQWRDLFDGEVASVEPTLGTRAFEHPCPVLVVGGDRRHVERPDSNVRTISVFELQSVHVGLANREPHLAIQSIRLGAFRARGEIDMGRASQSCLFQSMRDERGGDSVPARGGVDNDVFDPRPSTRGGLEGDECATGNNVVIDPAKEEVGRPIPRDRAELVKTWRSGARELGEEPG